MKKLISSPFIIISMIMILMNVNYSGSAGLEGLNFDSDDSPFLDAPIVDDKNEGERPWIVEESSQSNNTYRPQIVGESSQSIDRKYTFQHDPDWDQYKMDNQLYNNANEWLELQYINNDDEVSRLCVDFSSWKSGLRGYTRKCPECFQLGYDKKRRRGVVFYDGSVLKCRVLLFCNCFDQIAPRKQRIDPFSFLVAKHDDTSYYLLKHDKQTDNAYIFGYVENFYRQNYR